MYNDHKYWVWLSSIPKIGPRRSAQLIELFGSPKAIWELTENDLKKAGLSGTIIFEQLTNKKFRDESERHLENIYKNKIRITTINDEEYPYYLKNIHNPPIVLYVKGNIKKDEGSLAVVGSRRASTYGMNMAENLSYGLARKGIAVISGMARGIDSFAHKGALKAGGRTIAVLGCGLDTVYPSENKKLSEEIMDSGAVISEYVPGTPPVPLNFPARNRIISGISLGVIVIEASEKSGSLITADFALEQGREVFAVPGNINSLNSVGTNKLIKDGAKIVTGLEDILEELNFINYNNTNTITNQVIKNNEINISAILKNLDKDEKIIAECLLNQSVHIDSIYQKSGFSLQKVNATLVMMELKGIIEQMPGKIFKLI